MCVREIQTPPMSFVIMLLMRKRLWYILAHEGYIHEVAPRFLFNTTASSLHNQDVSVLLHQDELFATAMPSY